MPVELWQFDRPKGRSPQWAFRVTANGAVVFESAWVSIRYRAREDAAWLARLIDALAEHGKFFGCPGRPAGAAVAVRWSGDPGDDCSATIGDLNAHAEHLSGPSRGGVWYCSVTRSGQSLFHTADRGAQPRSEEAARWLCELFICAVIAGVGQKNAELITPADRGRS